MLLNFKPADVLASGLLDREGPLELPDDLRLPIGEAGFKLVGGDDRDSARTDRATDARAVIGGLGVDRELRADRQLQRRKIPGVLDDAALAARGRLHRLRQVRRLSGPR